MREPILFEIDAEIRQLLMDDEGPFLAIEYLDTRSNCLQTAVLNTETGLFNYTELNPVAQNRETLCGIHNGMIWLICYSNPELPVAQGISVYDLEGQKIWGDPQFQFQLIERDRLWGFKNDDYGYFELTTGVIFKTSAGFDHANRKKYPVVISHLIEENNHGFEEANSILKNKEPQKIWYAENNFCFALASYSGIDGLKIAFGFEGDIINYDLETVNVGHEGWAFVLKGKEICFLTGKSGFGIWKP